MEQIENCSVSPEIAEGNVFPMEGVDLPCLPPRHFSQLLPPGVLSSTHPLQTWKERLQGSLSLSLLGFVVAKQVQTLQVSQVLLWQHPSLLKI